MSSGGIVFKNIKYIDDSINAINTIGMAHSSICIWNMLETPRFKDFKLCGTPMIIQLFANTAGVALSEYVLRPELNKTRDWGLYNLLYRYWYRSGFIKKDAVDLPLVHYVLKKNPVNKYFVDHTPTSVSDDYTRGARAMRNSNDLTDNITIGANTAIAAQGGLLLMHLCIVILYRNAGMGGMSNYQMMIRTQFAQIITASAFYVGTMIGLQNVNKHMEEAANCIVSANCININKDNTLGLKKIASCSRNDVDLWHLYKELLTQKQLTSLKSVPNTPEEESDGGCN